MTGPRVSMDLHLGALNTPAWIQSIAKSDLEVGANELNQRSMDLLFKLGMQD